MTRNLTLICLSAALCTTAAIAQVEPDATDANPQATTTSPVAYVYVSSTPKNSSNNEVLAYAAAPNGKLTPVPGSPFQEDITNMAVNGKYLFGGTRNGLDVNAYFIEANGSLRYAASTNVVDQNQDCGSIGEIFLDHTGASLYNFDLDGSQCANNTYEAFAISKSTGKLGFLDDAGSSESLNGPMSFIGNNVFAYGSTCYHFGAEIYGFRRNSNGSFTELNLNAPYPSVAKGGWCPYLAAADPTNHLAIPMFPSQGYGDQNGPYQLATYTVSSSGSLSTTSTSANMPKVAVGYVSTLAMSPSGKLLAVGGTTGLQIFHFNGASPITAYTGLLTGDYIWQAFWDNENHLYALTSTGQLFVFTITPTGHSQAPGSPYTVSSSPSSLIVQPWPRY